MDEAVAHFFGLFLFLWFGFADGYIGIAALLFEAAAQIIAAAVDSAGTAFAFHIIVAVFGFDFITADVAANRFLDNHCLSSLKSSLIRCAPVWRPWM